MVHKLAALALSLLLWGCAGSGKSHRTAGWPQGDDTVFGLPPGSDSPRFLPYFEEYSGGTGWSLRAEPETWVEIPSERTAQGLPVLTAVEARHRHARLRIFTTHHYQGVPDSAETMDMIGYLFKVSPCTESAEGKNGDKPNEAAYLCGTGDTLYHWAAISRRDSLIYMALIESKLPLEKSTIGSWEKLKLSLTVDENTPLPTPTPSDSASRSLMAAVLNASGLKALEDSSHKLAMERFQAGLKLDKGCASCLINIAGIYQYRNQNAAGITELNLRPELVASSPRLMFILGSMHEAVGDYEQAKVWALRSLEKNPDDLETLINLSDALWGLGDRVRSKTVLLKPYGEKPGFRLAVYLASTHLGLEEYEKALEVLRDAHRNTPPDSRSTEYTLRALLGLKRPEDALAFLRDAPDSVGKTSANLYLQAVAEFHLKLYRLASASLSRSLLLDPANREAQQLATQTAAIIGDKSNHILRTRISPLKTESPLRQARALIATPEALRAAAEHPFIVLNRHIAYRWPQGGKWKRTEHLLCYIPDGEKLIRFSELTFDVVPGYSRFHVNAFKIYDSRLQLVGEGEMSRFYVTKNHNTTLHPENLLIHLPIEAKPGPFYLEVITTEEAENASSEFPYLEYVNAAAYPVLRTRYDIQAPPPGLRVNTFGEARSDSTAALISVELPEALIAETERFAPALDQVAGGFSAAPLKTWVEVGDEYLQRLAKSDFDMDSIPLAVREMSGELLYAYQGDPVKRFYRFVRDSIRYTNYEFNLHAMVPSSSETVLMRRLSDCKGHAVLLAQLLRTRGIDARLSLVHLTQTGFANQPSLHQFNHMIVHVPAGKDHGELYLDPTEKFQPFRASPLALEGKNVLLLEAGKSRMATIPELHQPGEHRVEIFHFLNVEANQSASGMDSVVMSGKIAAEFRAQLSKWKFNYQRSANILSWLAESYPHFTDEDFSILNEKDPDKPLVMLLKYRHKFHFQAHMEEFVHYPKLELSFLRYPKPEARQTPVYVPHEMEVRSQWIYRIPAGYAWKSLSLDREFSGGNLSWKLSIDQKAPEEIVIRQNWMVVPFVATPEEYVAIHKEWDGILGNAGLKLMIARR